MLFEEGVELHLLGDHGLALGYRLGAGLLAEREDDLPGLLRRQAPVDGPTRRRHLLFIALQVVVEMGKRVVLYGARLVAQRLELRQALRGLHPLDLKAALETRQRGLQIGVLQPGARVGDEAAAGRLHPSAPFGDPQRPRAGSPMAGRSSMPASTSAT